MVVIVTMPVIVVVHVLLAMQAGPRCSLGHFIEID